MQSETSTKRTIIITGGNKGIGYSIIDGLLAQDTPYDIIFTSRKPEAGQQALEKLQNAHKQSQSTLMNFPLSLTDPISTQHLVDFIKNERKKFDVLINNSGIMAQPETPLSKVETINVNLLSTIDFTEKLLPYLSSDGKVIMISSSLGLLEKQGPAIRKALEDPAISKESFLQLSGRLYEECEQGRHTESGFSESAYHASKALLNAYTRWILPRLLKGDQQCFSVCPGWCKTDLGGDNAPRTAEEGADTPVYLVGLPFKMDKNLHGKFIKDRKVIDY